MTVKLSLLGIWQYGFKKNSMFFFFFFILGVVKVKSIKISRCWGKYPCVAMNNYVCSRFSTLDILYGFVCVCACVQEHQNKVQSHPSTDYSKAVWAHSACHSDTGNQPCHNGRVTLTSTTGLPLSIPLHFISTSVSPQLLWSLGFKLRFEEIMLHLYWQDTTYGLLSLGHLHSSKQKNKQ